MLFNSKPRIEYKVIEVEKPRPLAENAEADSTIAGLQHHPGFLRLAAKLKLQRSLLETKLKHTRHEDIRDVDFLQSGIFWTNWLESEVDRQVYNKPRPTPQPSMDIEQAAFEAASQLMEEVGV